MPETQAIVTFWGAVLGGVLLGFLAGWLRGMLWGVAVGCLVIGAGASTAAASLGWQRWQFVAHAEHVQGTLTGQRNGPLVEFRSPDGAVHEVHGLGGSQSNAETGQAVPVHSSLLVGFGFALFLNDSLPEFGRAFLIIGVAAALFGLAFVFKREGGWMAPAIAFIVALGFVLFGGGAMLLA